jgi:hypothetical protein
VDQISSWEAKRFIAIQNFQAFYGIQKQ